MKEYNKLVRDLIPEIIKQDGFEAKIRTLSEEEFKYELLQKLVEEAKEVLETDGDPQLLVKELADVWEVIETIIPTFGVDQQEIFRVKQERKDKRGGFDQRIFLESTNE